ncbi:MAG TPA: hypothetical protein VMW78_01950 [Anaerolineae bacterium]|nr:hypothetical protein [Anaerolineae bacterium]
MEERLDSYENTKHSIRLKNEKKREMEEFDDGLSFVSERQVEISDVVQIGSKVLIGGGLGLLAGIAAIAVTASAAEIVLAGVVTKIAGLAGGGLGLSLGINKYKSKK